MKRRVVAFAFIAMSLTAFAGHREYWDSKEQKDIKVLERSWDEDYRSIPYVPSLSHNENTIHLYSAINFEDLQIKVLNDSGSIVYSDTINVFENQYYSFQINATETGLYTIQLENKKHSFWGQFTLY